MLEQQRAHLVDNRGALHDRAPTHAVERLQFELLGRLQRHAPPTRPTAGFRDGGRVIEIVLVA
jgi:hypothetical protein